MIESSPVRDLRESLKVTRFLGFTKRSKAANEASAYYWKNQYEDLPDWHDDGSLDEMAPKIQTGLVQQAVDQIVARLFGEGRSPKFKPSDSERGVDSSEDGGEEDEENEERSPAERAISDVVSRSKIKKRLTEIGRLGNLHGTVAVGFHIFRGGDRIDTEIINAPDSKVVFGRDDRSRAIELGIDFDDVLEIDELWRTVEERRGEENVHRLHRRVWRPNETVEFEPIELTGTEVGAGNLDLDDFARDDGRTVEHGLGFVPAVWIKNLDVTNDVDGRPAVDDAAFSLVDEINYTLSQAGRGLRYNQEPQLVVTDAEESQYMAAIKRSSKAVLQLSSETDKQADAELLELEGTATKHSVSYAKSLRQYFREVTSTIRHDPEEFAGALSGVALERLMYPLVELVRFERPWYGAELKRLVEKMVRAVEGIDVDAEVQWPPIVESTADDIQKLVTSVQLAEKAGFIDERRAIEVLAPVLGIEDPAAFHEKLKEERAQNQAPSSSVAERAFNQAQQETGEL